MVETRGQLDQVTIDHGTLAIEGWAATVGAGSVDGFTVTCSGRDVTDVDLTAGLPGPDVEADYQWLDGSGRRPLRARTRLSREQRALSRLSIITCAPIADQKEGRLLAELIEPITPVLREEHVCLAGGGSFLDISCVFPSSFIPLADLKLDAVIFDVG